MKSLRTLTVLIMVALLGLLWMATARQAATGRSESVRKITDGVWFREGDLKGKGHCNNVWIEMKDYLIVVDANFPSGAEACVEDIRKTSTKPVRYVFDTHHHGDHAYGNPVWTKLGATTLAYVGVAEEMKRYEPKRWQEAAKNREDVARLELETAEPPRQTFRDRRFVLKDETRTVEFYFFGWAHTRGDGFVYLPKERLLCSGDAVVNGAYNYMGDGNSANWPSVIDEALRLDIDTVLPGHGPPGTKNLLTMQKQFILELRQRVREAVRSGKKLEDLVTLQGGRPAATSVKLPEAVQNWVGADTLPAQVEVVYKEMTLGKPHGEILGGR